MKQPSAHMVTAVIGAGPAGLLFCIAARLLSLQTTSTQTPSRWTLALFDKRTAYARTHRLRMDPRPYQAMAKALQDERFDALMAFLNEARFKPVVNELEERLVSLAAELGVRKVQLTLGDGPEQTDLPALRAHLEEEGLLTPDGVLTVVGADSVHSTVRRLAMGQDDIHKHTHQQLVRLRVEGKGLPEQLGILAQVRLSKLINSLLDYRLNRNGFAEVDLFLGQDEHINLSALGAAPKNPVELDDALLKSLQAPLFKRIVDHLRDGFGQGQCRVMLYSSFKLEHQAAARCAAFDPASNAHIFLVGDAAVSLPFFRGMAALGQCVHHLATTLHQAALGQLTPQEATAQYNNTVQSLIRRELSVVKSRGMLISMARESSRISAMLPFPVQSWFLSMPENDAPGRLTSGFVLNVLVAAGAAGLALGGPLLRTLLGEPFGWIWALSIPAQALGGVVYYATRLFEPGPDRWIKRVWRVQIIGLMLLGVAATLGASTILGKLAQVHMTITWFLIGIPFIAGIYIFEWVQQRSWTSADLEA